MLFSDGFMNTRDAERCKTTAAHSHSTLGDSGGVFKTAEGDYVYNVIFENGGAEIFVSVKPAWCKCGLRLPRLGLPGHVPPSLEQRLIRLWTVSIISCCCLCRAVLLPVARFSCVSSSPMTPVCLPTSEWRLPFSCFSVSSSSRCRVSISSIFRSSWLRGKGRGERKWSLSWKTEAWLIIEASKSAGTGYLFSAVAKMTCRFLSKRSVTPFLKLLLTDEPEKFIAVVFLGQLNMA
ncbi:hypothetical protein EYF80_035036 [Liparis tanakae]|uniref:Uncharacterized protein n=1 Tax=Liparis tanakae TaxID=230148 RepID=A0A4Z2GPQ9_9TELE|nr:hypothetical protein EYF80_035036 [Liparis tanakae]